VKYTYIHKTETSRSLSLYIRRVYINRVQEHATVNMINMEPSSYIKSRTYTDKLNNY